MAARPEASMRAAHGSPVVAQARNIVAHLLYIMRSATTNEHPLVLPHGTQHLPIGTVVPRPPVGFQACLSPSPLTFFSLRLQSFAGTASCRRLPSRARKSTRLNLQSLMRNSYAVFCL